MPPSSVSTTAAHRPVSWAVIARNPTSLSTKPPEADLRAQFSASFLVQVASAWDRLMLSGLHVPTPDRPCRLRILDRDHLHGRVHP
jgi:hypothetical protein